MEDRRHRILYLEDNDPDAVLFEEALQRSRLARCDLIRAFHLADAARQLAQDHFDLILADLNVPDSRGLATFHELRTRAPDTPIVVLTGFQDEALAMDAVKSGAQDYLVKGRDSFTSIARAVQYAVARSQFTHRLRERDEQLRLLTEQLPCAFWTTDVDLDFTSFCGADRRGALPAPPALRNLADYLENMRVDGKMLAAHRKALDGQSSTFDWHWSERIFHVRVEPLHGADQRQIGTIGLALDVTDQRLLDLELRVTRQVHDGLRPRSVPLAAHFEVAGESHAAAEAGGDFFDYFPLSDGSTGIAVCDVAGHGLGAAMMMCQTRAYMRALGLARSNPAEFIPLLNDFLLCSTEEERLVALLIARLDPHSREFQFANAGHRGFLLPRDGAAIPLPPTTIPLNVMPEPPTEIRAPLSLRQGDLVLLYTDGVIEGVSRDNEPFGIQRMVACVDALREQPANVIVRGLFEEVRRFTRDGQREDDMTAVVVKAT